jgi:hypothetical protein
MKIEPCVHCGRKLKAAENINESGDPSVVVYTHMRTSGIRPMARAVARRRRFCSPCSISLGFGPPPEGAFNNDVYEGLSELAEKCPALKDVAYEQKFNPAHRPKLMPGSKPDELGTKTLPAAFREAS